MMPAGSFHRCQVTVFVEKLYFFATFAPLRCAAGCGPIGTHSIRGARPAVPFGWRAFSTSERVSILMLASTILQNFLTRMADAVVSGRFEDYSAGVHLPFSILTSSASISVNPIEDLEEVIDEFTEILHTRGVTKIVQTVKAAEFECSDRIVGIHQTRLMDGSRQVLPEYYSKMWIRCFDGVWKSIRTHNTTNETRWPVLLTRLAPEPWPTEEP